MTNAALEERIIALEETVATILEKVSTSQSAVRDWRKTLGMFDNDSLMKEIDEEGRKIREADREGAPRDSA